MLAAADEDQLRREGDERLVAPAAQAALVGGVGVAPRDRLPFRVGATEAGDPLADEWSLAVLSPHFAAAVVARRLGADGPYEFGVTHQRGLVAACARALAARLEPVGPP